jgi:hypothetical protein
MLIGFEHYFSRNCSLANLEHFPNAFCPILLAVNVMSVHCMWACRCVAANLMALLIVCQFVYDQPLLEDGKFGLGRRLKQG